MCSEIRETVVFIGQGSSLHLVQGHPWEDVCFSVQFLLALSLLLIFCLSLLQSCLSPTLTPCPVLVSAFRFLHFSLCFPVSSFQSHSYSLVIDLSCKLKTLFWSQSLPGHYYLICSGHVSPLWTTQLSFNFTSKFLHWVSCPVLVLTFLLLVCIQMALGDYPPLQCQVPQGVKLSRALYLGVCLLSYVFPLRKCEIHIFISSQFE